MGGVVDLRRQDHEEVERREELREERREVGFC